MEGMTSLEELTIEGPFSSTVRWLVDGLGSLWELRVLNILYISWDEDRRDLVESLGHLHKLQSLRIDVRYIGTKVPTWHATDLVLPHHLRHLSVGSICFSKLPPGLVAGTSG
jgi:hypothetical protein